MWSITWCTLQDVINTHTTKLEKKMWFQKWAFLPACALAPSFIHNATFSAGCFDCSKVSLSVCMRPQIAPSMAGVKCAFVDSSCFCDRGQASKGMHISAYFMYGSTPPQWVPPLPSFLAGNFMPGGENGTIMKKSGENERNALRQLLDDPLRNFVPEFKREVEHDGHGKAVLEEGEDLRISYWNCRVFFYEVPI